MALDNNKDTDPTMDMDQKTTDNDSMAEHLEYSPEEEQAIRRKIDRHLLPMLTLMYIISYLDRSNIGNAAIIGLKEDLHLTEPQYNLCLTIFFIPYALFEVPANLMLKVMRPSLWIGIMMLAWGTTATLAGLVKDFSGLMAVRVCLAIGEAGFFPAASYLLTVWYRRHEIQFRAAIFYSAGALAGAVSGLLAFLINKMDGVGGLAGWRWVFILEGILTVLIATGTPWFLPDDPKTCTFLTLDEKNILAHRLRFDTGTTAGSVDAEEGFKWKYVWAALLDYRVWAVVIVYWGSSIPIYGFIYTLPAVVKEMGYTASIAQLMTVPIYVAAVICLLLVAFFSDRAGDRSLYVIGPLVVGLVGFVGLLAIPKDGSATGGIFAMLFLVAAGLYAIVCGTVAWTANNLAGPWKRSVGMALMIAVGNLGGAAGTNIYLTREAPFYWTGYGVSLGIVVLSLIVAIFLRFKLKSINASRDAMSMEEINAKYSEQELLDMGDDSPLFRYTI